MSEQPSTASSPSSPGIVEISRTVPGGKPVLAGLQDLSKISYAGASSVLIYGPTGIGKTTTVFKYKPRPGKRRFVFDVEAGLKSVAETPDTDVFRVTSYPELFRAIGFLEQSDDHDIGIVDNLTEMARVIMLGALSQPAMGQGRPFPEIPILQDWSLTIERMRNLTRRIRLLISRGKMVFFTCASSMEKDQLTGRIIGRPELPGKQLPEEIPYLMDEVYRMDVHNTPAGPRRALFTTPDTIWTAKSRVRGLAPIIYVDLNDEKVLDHLRPKE